MPILTTANLNDQVINLEKELILIDNVNFPFSSILLNKGTEKATSVIVDWKYERLDTDNSPAIEGGDVTTFNATDYSLGDKNVCQIFRKAVAVSGTATAVQLNTIQDLFVHEVENRMLEVKRDLEYYLINGVYSETEPRQMKGLLNFISAENTISASAITIQVLQEMAKLMRKAGTASNNLVLLCDYNTTDAINALFDEKQRYINVTNEFGNPVVKLNLTYGSAFVYTVDAMPVDTMVLANPDLLSIAELRPVQYQDLAPTGDAKKGMVVMECTLKFKHPVAAVKFVKVAA